MSNDAPTDVIDIKPHIVRRRRSACEHEYVAVDETSASLTCCDCDAEIDPLICIESPIATSRTSTLPASPSCALAEGA